jgi:hypothetical protein
MKLKKPGSVTLVLKAQSCAGLGDTQKKEPRTCQVVSEKSELCHKFRIITQR